ncbi:MAG: serine/threonine-protein kinase [Gemmatimonadales bacterium]
MRLPDFPSTCTLTPVDRLDRAAHPGGVLAPSDLLSTVREALRDRYAVAGEIGRGGMAVVCRATDLRHGREVAIKVLLPELARAVTGDRFLREISILARLSHPNILPLLDSGSVEVVPGLDVPWYVMPYVAEDTLRARLDREGPLPVEQALHLTRELCDALSHAHRQGIIHRDIKPENILLSGGQAVLADFGIARAVTLSGTSSLSSTGLVIGTPAYMSPEQSAGSEKLDARSDLYSLGVVLYEMLAGQPPFTGATPQAISARHQFETPPPIRVVRPTIPVGVEAVLSRVLEKVPADRYESAEGLARALEGATTGAGRLLTPTAEVPRSRRRTLRARWLVAGGVAVGLGIAAIVAARGFGDPPPLAPDPDRFAVMPFRHVEVGTQVLISGVNCEFLIDQALGEYPDLKRVDHLVVNSAMESRGAPTNLDSIRATALRLGAGKVIWGEVWQEGDSLRIRGVVYPTTGPASQPIHSAAISLPLPLAQAGGRQVAMRFAELALDLVLLGKAGPMQPAAMLTSSFQALLVGLRGDSARAAWDLDLAEQEFRYALRIDPQFALMQARLAEIGAWRQGPVEEWRPWLVAALRDPARLSHQELELAEAGLALANEDYPDACRRYRAIIARDSGDVRALIGLGDCLSRDELVLPDSSSKSGWRFRTSLDEAALAYQRAFRLVPAAHQAYFEVVSGRLLGVSFTNSSQRRVGRSDGPDPVLFSAVPGLDGDSIVFVPYTASAGARIDDGTPREDPRVFQRSGRFLSDLATVWISAYPQSPGAWRAAASIREALGLAGDSSSTGPLALVRQGLQISTDAVALRDLRLVVLRLLLKQGQYRAAAAMADTLLFEAPNATGDVALRLAPVAALRGDATLAAALLQSAGPAWAVASGEGVPVELPAPIRASAAALYAYSSIGGMGDSVSQIEGRLERQVDAWAAPRDRQRIREAVFLLPAILAFPEQGRRPIHEARVGWYLPSLQSALLEGKKELVLDSLRALDASRGGRVDDLAPEIALQEAWLLAAAGDRTAALGLLRRVTTSLAVSARLDLLATCQSAAAFLRMRRLERALRTGNEPEPWALELGALAREH